MAEQGFEDEFDDDASEDEDAAELEPNFSVSVRNFGPIAEGAVSLAPLTVLVGKNSTGKSYMASLLWSLMSSDGLVPSGRRSWSPPDWFVQAALNAVGHGDEDASEFSISVPAIETWVNDNLKATMTGAIERLFSSDRVTAEEIRLRFRPRPRLRGRWEPWDDYDEEEDEQRFVSSYSWSGDRLDFSFRPGGSSGLVGPFNSAVKKLLFDRWPFDYRNDGTFIPAARTGLILALPSLVESSLDALGADELRPRTKFPLPTIRFLQQLAQRGSEGRFADVADFLERAVLGGRIAQDEDPHGKGPPDYYFEAEDSGRLPLFVTSSMITEMAPILVCLRRAQTPYFVIEEPEAHLHLSAQRQMARAVVRLVNLGATVVVTTHSDTFLQQLNLSVAFGAQPQKLAALREAHGYGMEDVLRPGAARCFEFIASDGRTAIVEAPLTEDGFVVRSINEPLADLTEEVVSVQSAPDGP